MKPEERGKVGLLFIFGILIIIFTCGVFIIETTIASFITLYLGIDIGMIVATGFAGLNLVVLSYVGLDLIWPFIQKTPETGNTE